MKFLWPTSVIPLAAIAVMPVLAQAVDPVTPSEAARSADENKVICKTKTGTDSRMPKRTCMTRAQWEEVRIQNQRDLKEMVDRPKICGGGGNAEGC